MGRGVRVGGWMNTFGLYIVGTGEEHYVLLTTLSEVKLFECNKKKEKKTTRVVIFPGGGGVETGGRGWSVDYRLSVRLLTLYCTFL